MLRDGPHLVLDREPFARAAGLVHILCNETGDDVAIYTGIANEKVV